MPPDTQPLTALLQKAIDTIDIPLMQQVAELARAQGVAVQDLPRTVLERQLAWSAALEHTPAVKHRVMARLIQQTLPHLSPVLAPHRGLLEATAAELSARAAGTSRPADRQALIATIRQSSADNPSRTDRELLYVLPWTLKTSSVPTKSLWKRTHAVILQDFLPDRPPQGWHMDYFMRALFQSL